MRTVLQSNNSLIFMTKEGYSDTAINSYLWAGVVKSSFGISTERESSSQLGSRVTIVDDLVRHPNVEFSVDYLFSPNFLNEKLVGFSTGSYIESGTLADMGNDNYNFIHVHRNRQYYDGLEHYREGGYNNNYEAVCLGNMFLNSYRVQYSLGEVVTASMNFIGSNINYERLSSDTVVNPSVDLAVGAYNTTGDILLHPPLEYGMGYSGIHDRSLPSLVSRRNITPELQNLQMGGQTLSGDHFLQNFDLSLNFNRVDAYGLGSDYVYGRNLQYPIRGQASLSSYVSGFNEGQISGMLEGETGYEFTINFADEDNLIDSYYRVENAKLESFDYSMDVNGEMLMNASFSFVANQNNLLVDVYELWWSGGLMDDTAQYTTGGVKYFANAKDRQPLFHAEDAGGVDAAADPWNNIIGQTGTCPAKPFRRIGTTDYPATDYNSSFAWYDGDTLRVNVACSADPPDLGVVDAFSNWRGPPSNTGLFDPWYIGAGDSDKYYWKKIASSLPGGQGMYSRQRLNFPTAPDLYLDVVDPNGWDGENLFDLSDSGRIIYIEDASSDGSIDVLNTQQKNLRLNSSRIDAYISHFSGRRDQTINIIAGITGAGPYTYASVNRRYDTSDTPHIVISGDPNGMYFTFGTGLSLAANHSVPNEELVMITAVDNPTENRVECYINGQFVTGADSSHLATDIANVVTINAEQTTEGIGFLFQSAAHFNSALSAAEITQLYNIFKGRLGSPIQPSFKLRNFEDIYLESWGGEDLRNFE